MTRTQTRLLTGGIIVAIILLWFWLRKIPAVQQAVQQTASNLGLPDTGALLPLDQIDLTPPVADAGDYVARDQELPPLNDTSAGYTPCNFCMQSSATVQVPSPPAVIRDVVPAQIPKPKTGFLSVGFSGGGRSTPPTVYGPTGAPLGEGYIPGIFGGILH